MNSDAPPAGLTEPTAIILIHGHRQVMGSMQRFAHELKEQGHRTLSFQYCSMTTDLPCIVDSFEPAVRDFADRSDGPVHFIGHSLGGLLIRALLARYRPDNLGHAVMMGTPHGGSEWADLALRLRLGRQVLGSVGNFLTTKRAAEDEALLAPVDYPLGCIAGQTPFQALIPPVLPRPHDGTVSVASTRIAGMTDHLVLPVTHALMPANKQVRAQALHFLAHGRFQRS